MKRPNLSRAPKKTIYKCNVCGNHFKGEHGYRHREGSRQQKYIYICSKGCGDKRLGIFK